MWDIDDIQYKFNEVIKYSQNIDTPLTDELFSNWKKNKAKFIEAMGGELIYEYPEKVYFELSEAAKDEAIDNFLDYIERYYYNRDLVRFIAQQREGFYSNQVVSKYTTHDGIVIPVGMKLVKAFKYFIEGEATLNKIQMKASMIIQSNKIEGTLCLSVHPLDYLSISENAHAWRTCQSLDGDYRAGNLSYLRDATTLVCYLKSDAEEDLPNFPNSVKWNSKKWRVLLYISEDNQLMFAGRQYPFVTNTGINFVKENLLPAAGLGHWSDWCKKKIKAVEENDIAFSFYSPYIPLGNKLETMRDIVAEEPNSLMFDDLLYSSCYDPLYAYKMEENHFRSWNSGLDIPKYVVSRAFSERTKLHMGGSVSCCRCGSDKIFRSQTFMCDDCYLEYGDNEDDEDIVYCSCCGRRIWFEDSYLIEDRDLLCSDCADEYTISCDKCRDYIYKENAVEIEENRFVCGNCAEVM